MSDRTHPAAIEVGGKPYLRDSKGSLVPLEAVKPVDLLMDELVRARVEEAHQVSRLLTTFRIDTFDGVAAFQDMLAQEYGAAIGGKKGNISLISFDGCQKIQISVADRYEYGPELKQAKQLIDECLTEWATASGTELRALVNHVFRVDKQNQINRSGLLQLLRLGFTDERWLRAMEAINNSARPVDSKEYVRFYHRPSTDGQWLPITLDLANA